MNPTRLADSAARHVAATERGINLVVLAGAGTGKTSLLVERLLNALGAGALEIHELAAITFTEKAAGELRRRIASGLDRLRSVAVEEQTGEGHGEAERAFRELHGQQGLARQEIARRALEAMEGLDQAVVVTIHSFCSQLLREYPLEAGVDPGFVIDTGEQAETLRRSAWDRFLERELGPQAPRPELWGELLARLDLKRVGIVAQGMADFGIPPSLLRPPFEPVDLARLLGDELDGVLDGIADLRRRAGGITEGSELYFDRVVTLLQTLRAAGPEKFREALERDSVLQSRLINLPKANKKLSGVSAGEFNECVRVAANLVKRLQQVDETTSRLLLEAIAPFVLEFRESFLMRGLLSFDALLVLARDLLRDHPRVRARLKRRFRMLLVDEFQDTDPLQYEIMLFLAEREEESATSALAANLAAGRLFVVGDAKQSIYRFRGADYAAYRQTVDRIVDTGGRALTLQANFRSVPGLLEPVNALFSAAAGCWAESAFQPPYVAIEAVRDAESSEPAVELWTVRAPGDALAAERREVEGRVLAERIEQLVDVERVCDYSEITILFRAFTNISFYLRPLRERGIPFVVDGGREFLERPEVTQLMALLRAMTQPADGPAVLAFLRSPAGGVPDTVLADFAAAGGRWDWRHERQARPFPEIAARFRLLRELAEECRDLPADAAIRRVVGRTHLLALGAAAFEGAQRVANLRKLATAAGDLSRDGRLSLQEVVEGLREGRLIDIKTDSPIADEAAQAVRITSIHRMKGLENRWIFLPDFARGKHRGAQGEETVSAVRLPDGSPALAVRAGKRLNGAAAWREPVDRQHEAAEEVRVLYVGLTRARDRLVVLCGPSRGEAEWITALRPWGYAADDPPEDGARIHAGQVLHRVLQPTTARRERVADHPLDAAGAVRRFRQAAQRAVSASRPPFLAPSATHDEEPRAPLQPSLFEPPRRVAKAVGIVVHRWLESWDGRAGPAAGLGALARDVAAEESIESDVLERLAAELLETFLGSELARRFREGEILGRELPLLLEDETGALFRGNIDLVYRDAQGKLAVADFKTDREVDEEQLRGRYAAQLDLYARAVRQAWELPDSPRKEIWWLRGGRIVVLR